VARLVWLPVAAWLLATSAVFATCALSGRSPFRTAPWVRWDSFQYLDISRRGYTLVGCVRPSGLLAWCGNAPWFPAYPWVVRAVAAVGLDHAVVAVVLAWLFQLATVLLLWSSFYRRRVDFEAVAAVLFAAFAPGLIYDYAVFPLSMLAFFTVLYLRLLSREQWLLAGLTGFVLVLTYPVGIAAPIAATLALLTAYRRVPDPSRRHRALLSVGPSVVALGLLPVVQAWSTGHWDAYFLANASYGHTLVEPFSRTIHAVELLAHRQLFTLANAPYAQALLVTFAVACVLAALVFKHAATTPFQVLFALWMLVAWLIPQATAGTSEYRAEAVLLPMAVMIGTLPRFLAVALVAAAVAISIPIEVLFLRGTLI